MSQVMYREEEQHLIENYELAKADDFKGWVLHHRLEFDLEGKEVHTPESLIRLGMYYNRPYFELIYLTRSEHNRLHRIGKHASNETKNKLSESHKGKPSWNKGISQTQETKDKIRETLTGRTLSQEHRDNVSKSMKGKSPSNLETLHKLRKGKKLLIINGKRTYV